MAQNEPRKKALVVAVSEYDDDLLHDLPFCKNDGNDMTALLGDLGYKVTNQDLVGRVDGRYMQDCVYDFFNDDDIRSNDTILFYFSGHGIVGFDDTFMSASNMESKIPNKRGFSFNDLRSVMEGCRSKCVIVILDCCYAGSAKISKGEEASLVSAARNHQSSFKQGEGKCLLSASLGFQESFATEMGDHSFFTHYLLSGLKGAEGKSVDKDGIVTPESLMQYIDSEIDMLPINKRPSQTPLRKIETVGRIILAQHPHLATESSDTQTDKKTTSIESGGFIGRGDYYLSKKDYEKAIECYDKALEIEPENVYALRSKGSALERLDRYDDAIKIYNKGLSLFPNTSLKYNWFLNDIRRAREMQKVKSDPEKK